MKHHSERLSQSLQDSMPSTKNTNTQMGPSIKDLPTDAIAGILDQVKTTPGHNFSDLSDPCAYS